MKKEKILNIVFIKDNNTPNHLTGAYIFKKGKNPEFVSVEDGITICRQLLAEKKHSNAIKKFFAPGDGECNIKYIYKLDLEEMNDHIEQFKKSSKNPIRKRTEDDNKKRWTALALATALIVTMPSVIKAINKKKSEEPGNETTTSFVQESNFPNDDVMNNTTTKRQEEYTTERQEEYTTERQEEYTTERQEEYTTERQEEYTTERPEEYTTERPEESTNKEEDIIEKNTTAEYYTAGTHEYEEPWIGSSDDIIYSNDPEKVKYEIAGTIVELMSKANNLEDSKTKVKKL